MAAALRHPALRDPREAEALARRKLAGMPAPLTRQRRAWARRLPVLAQALGAALPVDALQPRTVDQLGSSLGKVVDPADPSQAWLALAVLSGTFPTEDTVVAVVRRAAFDGGLELARAIARSTSRATVDYPVEVVSDVIVDVDHTVDANFLTGIQRVVDETVPRWIRDHQCLTVRWTEGQRALRRLRDDEVDRRGWAGSGSVAGGADPTLLVPWEGTYLLPELALELDRLDRIRALTRFARVRAGVIGYDCVPVTSAETVALGVGHFARYLGTIAYFDAVVAISEAAATEFRGWCQSLAGIGLTGPRVLAVPLPTEVPEAKAAATAHLRELFDADADPVVLVVGSHEPRKNHLAVLHAAELLWREGQRFHLVFAGSRGWGAEDFAERLGQLSAQGRRVTMATDLTDDALFAAYRLARFSVFPSLTEGFGLPVAESLACGTPVITSGHGSMLEIARHGGALTVDPRDDHALADAMRELLVDDEVRARLAGEARALARRSWDDYAADAWQALNLPDAAGRSTGDRSQGKVTPPRPVKPNESHSATPDAL